MEGTLDDLLCAEGDCFCNAAQWERPEAQKDTRAGRYERKHQTKNCVDGFSEPSLRNLPLLTAIIVRCRPQWSAVEEALGEMYPAAVSVRMMNDFTEPPWDTNVSPCTVRNPNQDIWKRSEERRNRPMAGSQPYVLLNGIVLRLSSVVEAAM